MNTTSKSDDPSDPDPLWDPVRGALDSIKFLPDAGTKKRILEDVKKRLAQDNHAKSVSVAEPVQSSAPLESIRATLTRHIEFYLAQPEELLTIRNLSCELFAAAMIQLQEAPPVVVELFLGVGEMIRDYALHYVELLLSGYTKVEKKEFLLRGQSPENFRRNQAILSELRIQSRISNYRIIVLHRFAGLTPVEIAALLGRDQSEIEKIIGIDQLFTSGITS